MSKADLTAQRLRELLHYDPETGIFTRKLLPTKWGDRPANGEELGCPAKNQYLRITVDGRSYLAHRLAWFYVYGTWPQGDIDHLNGGRVDNRIANLRDTTRSINLQNRRTVRGITFDKQTGKYRAGIQVDGARYDLGRHDTAEEAHQAYLQAKARLHPGFIASRLSGRP